MVRLAEFVLSATTLLWLSPASIVRAKEDNDDKPLFFRPLDYFAPCADGSPAGIYTDFFGSANETRNSHVIHFQGGGGCSSESSCQILYRQKPYFFSSLYEFESITGHTIVSNDPFENPGLADDFAKWVVPYCSQDLWLGSGIEAAGFHRSGSLHVNATLRHWLDAVTASDTSAGAVDTLVVSGHSAGNFAILNHMDQIRNIANEAGVKRLRFVLDASMLTDQLSADLESLIPIIVDPEVHPLCLEDHKRTPYDELLNREELSQLPCCLSTHCMLRHSPSMSAITSEASSSDERILLIDTAYDFLQTFSYLVADGGNRNAVGGNSIDDSAGMISVTGVSSSLFNVGESGGIRKARVLETLFSGGRYVGPNVVWAMPSAILHNTLVPSAEISTRLCTREVTEEDTVCESGDTECIFLANPLGIQEVCNATGIGLSLEVFGGLKITQWTNTEAWKRSTINGKSIRDIISDFVLTAGPTNGSNSSEQTHATFLFDSCPGPNCVPEGQQSGNPVMSLLEIEDTFVNAPGWLMALVSMVLFAIVVAYVFMAYYPQKNVKDGAKMQTTQSLQSDIHLRGLYVESNEGSKILEDVDLSLRNSTLNCLLGKSGSGKSTLLSVLCCQLKSNLNVSLKSASDIRSIPTTFMRQLDLVTMENITPVDYLISTSKIYGADSETLEFVLGLIKPFFPVKTAQDENNVEIVVLDPFNNAAIKDLSGGQRRMLAIAASFFQNTSLLLLDEPLSGLDSVSSMKVIDLLSFIAKEKSVTILMTLHQPSCEILEAMNGIIVLAKGKVTYDSRLESIKGIKSSRGSYSDFFHNLLSETGEGKAQIVNIKEGLEYVDDSMSPSSSLESVPLRVKSKERLESCIKKLRLWQVRPLVRRMSLEHSPKPRDFLVLPICILIVAGWASFDAKNPLLAILQVLANICAAAMINQVKIVVNWDILSAHRWDLEDKRISPLSFLVASSFQMFYAPIISITLSLAINHAVLGWNWESFVPTCLFMTLMTIVLLQFGKTISAITNQFQIVAGVFNVFIFLGFVMSGSVVNPNKIPVAARWMMYMTPIFWGNGGTLLTMFQYTNDLGEQPCQSFASCIVYNPNFMAHVTGFPALITARAAMFVLIGMFLILALIEYILLCRKVVQRNDYTMLSDSKTNSIVDEEEVEFTKQANDGSNAVMIDFESISESDSEKRTESESESEEVDVENNGIIEF
eukprot:CAMPEP_0116131588 /NCGR_PEP_ID=MMETSP0329-20121206/9088_1 /TAXON_ID=697910 /ORGANISM="Pseudo-nitzschia arenysensis, Strain B593" /LENGTH=1203 /DNA_ID=CAMNT_0003626033 /DNA_START=45 /DNA_END=3656 /DNA_ORIENTATION=-